MNNAPARNYKHYSSRAAMTRDGWTFSSEPKVASCRECGADVEWCQTPRGKNVPINAHTCVIHWETCERSGSAPAQTSTGTAAPARAAAPSSVPQPQAQPQPQPSNAGSPGALALKQSMDELTVAVRALTSLIAFALALKQSMDELTVAVRALTSLIASRRSAVTPSNPITDEDVPF